MMIAEQVNLMNMPDKLREWHRKRIAGRDRDTLASRFLWRQAQATRGLIEMAAILVEYFRMGWDVSRDFDPRLCAVLVRIIEGKLVVPLVVRIERSHRLELLTSPASGEAIASLPKPMQLKLADSVPIDVVVGPVVPPSEKPAVVSMFLENMSTKQVQQAIRNGQVVSPERQCRDREIAERVSSSKRIEANRPPANPPRFWTANTPARRIDVNGPGVIDERELRKLVAAGLGLGWSL